MADRIFKPKPGEEIVITVARGKQPASPMGVGVKRRKGIVRTLKRDDFLPRRLKRLGGINFYDLGRVKVGGVFQDLDFLIPHTLPIAPGTGAWVDELPLLEPEDAATYRDDLIFAVPLADWKTSFYRIEKAMVAAGAAASTRYKISVSLGGDSIDVGSSDKWTSEGLNLTEDDLASGLALVIDSDLFFEEEMNFTGNEFLSASKITAVRDYNSEPVAFTPGTKMDIFLMPNFVAIYGRAFEGETTKLLNYFFTNHSRAQFLTHHQTSDPLYVIPAGIFNSTPESTAKDRTIEFFKQVHDNRTLISTPVGGGSYTATTETGAAFSDGINEFGEFVRNETKQGFSARVAGILVAVINKGGEWFYVWND